MINLLHYQPDLILVDSLTTNIKSHEFCGQIRRTNKFKNTPIIFFNNNEGVVGWLRNRIDFSTEYIANHFSQQELLAILNKYI
jgi:CheY-like chemotaxis protein